jgi:hypothetical protein
MKLSNSFFLGNNLNGYIKIHWGSIKCGPLVLDASSNISYIDSSNYPKVKLVKVLNKSGVAHVMDKISHTLTFESIDCASPSFSSYVDNNNCNMCH